MKIIFIFVSRQWTPFLFKCVVAHPLSPGPQVIKLFFMLNSVEHEILNARKYINIKKLGFTGSDKPRMLYFPAHKC